MTALWAVYASELSTCLIENIGVCCLLNATIKTITITLQYSAKAIDIIVNQLKYYREQVEKWKKDDHTIIGYARKSALPLTNDDTRRKCLNRMVEVLRGRSNVNLAYVSWSTASSASLGSRDNDGYDVKQKVRGCDGNTQGKVFTVVYLYKCISTNANKMLIADMMKYLRLEKNPVVIVSITYAGFTTSCRDLIDFLG